MLWDEALEIVCSKTWFWLDVDDDGMNVGLGDDKLGRLMIRFSLGLVKVWLLEILVRKKRFRFGGLGFRFTYYFKD